MSVQWLTWTAKGRSWEVLMRLSARDFDDTLNPVDAAARALDRSRRRLKRRPKGRTKRDYRDRAPDHRRGKF